MHDLHTHASPEVSARICDKMHLLELQHMEAETDLSKLRIQLRIKITKKEVTAWLSTFSRGDLFDMNFRAKLIDTFINSVYLWDEKLVIFYNVREGKQVSAIDMIREIDEKTEPPEQSSTLPGGSGA